VNCTLKRNEYRDDGIFGVLSDETGKVLFHTLEHSYSDAPKIPAGVYICLRGQHLLAGAFAPIDTFEVQNVPGHTGILIHPGNYNEDSSGCILLGESIAQTSSCQMITSSREAFKQFMEMQGENITFTLTVVS